MNLRELNYNINMDGISPGVEQFGGTQGDHRVTKLNFIFSDKFHQEIVELGAEGDKVMYRFDIYDGEGGVWSSETVEFMESSVSIELEERHTRFGGKITVYFVITSLSADNETQAELYSFPAVIRLKNRPEGVYQEGENYESISSLARITKQKAVEANVSAAAAKNTQKELEEMVDEVEEKLKNGEFDGVGVEAVEIVNNELIITYTDGASENLGNVKGEKGEQGIQGEKGDTGPAGKDAVTDQTYNAESENAQSGKAVAEALKNHYTKEEANNEFAKFDSRIQNALDYGIAVDHKLDENYYTKAEVDYLAGVRHVYKDSESAVSLNSPAGDSFILIDDKGDIVIHSENDVTFEDSRLMSVGEPQDDTDAATKGYVDEAVKNINIGDADVDVSGKVDKITLNKMVAADDYELGVYGNRYNVDGADGTYYDGNPALIHVSNGAKPNTIPKRDATGAISVSIGIKDSEGNNYVGGAAPHTWVNDRLNELNQRLYDFKNSADNFISLETNEREQADKALEDKFEDYTPNTEFNLLKNVVEGKKITKYTIAAGGSLTLKKNAVYILLADGSSNTASIYNNGVLQYEGTDNELTFKVGIIIIPDNTMGSSVEYPPSYYSLAIKISSGSSLLGIPDVNSAKFSVLKEVMENGGLVAKENSGNSTFSVWEIAL